MEQLGYLTSTGGIPLYAAYHPPRGNVPAAGVLIAPSLFEERKSAYSALRRMAEVLAGAGHPVLRFDYRGSGESGGEGAARRWTDLGADLEAARAELVRLSGCQDVALLGLRLGGTLVLQHAERLKAKAVVAIAPVTTGATQVRLWKMRSKIRAELTAAAGGQGVSAAAARPPATLDFDGFDVSALFFEDVAQIDLPKELHALPCPTLLLQVSHRAVPTDESQRLQAALGPSAALECLRLEPFWDKIDEVNTHGVEAAVLKALQGG